MRTVMMSIAAALIVSLGLVPVAAPAGAEIQDLRVSTDGFGPANNTVIIKANARSAVAKTRVRWWSVDIPESDCDPAVEPACEVTFRTRLKVWDGRGKRIERQVVDTTAGSARFDYRVRAPGRYTTEATVTEYLNGERYDQRVATKRFRVFKQKRSRLPINRSRVSRGGFKWKAVGDLNVLGAGPKRDRRQKVWLLVRIDGYWFDIDSARTNRKGKVGWLFKPNRYTWSMCYAGTADKRVRGVCGRNFRTPRVGSGLGRVAATTPSLEDARASFVTAP